MEKEQLQIFFNQYIPFNQFLGLQLLEISDEIVRIRVPYRPEFIGDPRRPALHGGIISTLLDTAGGAIAFAKLDWVQDAISTIDMRVDYLLPGRPLDLIGEARVMRKGNKVVVTHMWAYHPDQPDKIIAEGRGVYNISKRRDETKHS